MHILQIHTNTPTVDLLFGLNAFLALYRIDIGDAFTVLWLYMCEITMVRMIDQIAV